jgi:hypothetical protein
MYRTISIGLVTIIIAGYFVFAMKREVEILNFEKKTLAKQIKYEKDTINLLKAEFCHLTSPSRLGRLSKQYLALHNVTPDRMVQDPLKDQVIQKVSKELNSISASNKNIKLARANVWRFKKSPLQSKQYVKHAALQRQVVR